MEPNETLLQFPCRFPIKIMTRAGEDAVRQVIDAVERHAGALPEEDVRLRASRHGNYTAISLVIEAASREQLDAIYQDITALKVVEMAL